MLLLWARGKLMAWDVTVPDTYAESHISSTVVKAGAAAHRAAQNKMDKYARLASTHIFCPFAIETAGTWHETAIEVTQEIVARVPLPTPVHGSSAGECGLLPKYYDHRMKCRLMCPTMMVSLLRHCSNYSRCSQGKQRLKTVSSGGCRRRTVMAQMWYVAADWLLLRAKEMEISMARWACVARKGLCSILFAIIMVFVSLANDSVICPCTV